MTATTGRNRRSEATRERLLATVERLLVEGRDVNVLTVNEICVEADVGPSSLYNLYASKDDLLVDVHRRFTDRVRDHVRRVAASADWASLDPREIVVAVLGHYLDFLRDEEPLVSSMVALRRSSVALADEHLRNEMDNHALARELVLAATGREGDEELGRRVDLVMLVAVASVQRSFTSHQPVENLLGMDREEFLERLADMIVAYLTSPVE